MQISKAILLRTLFRRHTSDNVSMGHHSAVSFQVFNITAKDQN